MKRYQPTQQRRADNDAVDFYDTFTFRRALDPSAGVFTFQTFDDNRDRELKDKRLGHHQTDTFDACAEWLKEANGKYAGVFVTINPTDGCGRTKKNVTAVRAVMLDLDGAPLDPVRECALKPHIITETSPGNYHAFWRVEGLGLDQFEDVQRGLAKRFDGDPAVATLERCTRLPGFFHCKDVENPFLVRIVETNDRPPYTAEQITKEFKPLKKPHKPAGSLKDAIIVPSGAPTEAADKFVEQRHMLGAVPLLRHWRGAFYAWTGTHYRLHRDEDLERDLYAFLKGIFARKENGNIAPFNPTKTKVAEVVHALRRSALLLPTEWEAPFWLAGLSEPPQYKPARDLIATGNGLLNLMTRKMTGHDPLYFSTNCLPFDYDPDAPEPKQFYKFLDALKLDQEMEDTLQEIFGYLLTDDTRQQKIFLIVGPRRGGKGTLVFVLEQLLGKDNITYQTLDSLTVTGEFGRWPLIDMKLAVFADARLGSRGNIHRLVETLLSISG